MTYIRIKGGKRICGEVTLQGSKNAVLPMIAASILIRGVTVIGNCPDITDVREMLMQLQQTGARYTFYDHVLVIDCSEVFLYDGEKKEASKTRGSVLFLGAFLGRFSEARISYPGGCVIGSRPIDLHCELLRSLGVTISEQEDALYACGCPAGAELFLRSPSVGATENAILAAVCAKGRTVLHGAATEPEVSELCSFLVEAGAKISGIGTNILAIDGVESLHEVCHLLTGDRIVAGTFLCAAMVTGGQITIHGTKGVSLTGFDRTLRRVGLYCEQKENCILATGIGKLFPVDLLVTAPYPGFPTDMQSLLMAVLALADGESRLCETVFESRFKIVPELNRMGAAIEVRDRMAVIHGVPVLTGATVMAKELRGGAALLLAGLAATGETRVYGCENIARGYEAICERLCSLGAEIDQMEEA